MDKEQLLQIIETFKLLKSSYVVSYGNIIMGCDKNFVYFKKIELDYNLPTLALDMLEVSKLLKESEDISNINITDDYIYNQLMGMMCRVNARQFTSSTIYNDIHNDSDFIEADSLKTTQGIKYIIRDNKYVIPIYSGLLSTVKGDKVDLEIFEMIKDVNSKYDQVLCKFTVHKKKKINAEVYLLCRHMM